MVPLRRTLERASSITAADYARTRNEMVRVRREIVKVFNNVDFLISQVAQGSPTKVEDLLKADAAAASATTPAESARASVISVMSQFSFYGLPAISVPCGFRNDGFPLGIQIIGPPWGEGRVFALAHAFEQATEWHKRRPTLPEPTEKKL